MADETPMSPISEAVPPKANPLATPATAHAATLKLKPVIRKPAIGGATATQTALKPGLKLPTKPGIATAGLKLPPKPGATQTALKPGLKLPTRPVIRKPGEATPPAAVTAAKAVVGQPAAPAPVSEMTPVADLPTVDQPKPLEALKAVTQNLKSITSPIPQQAVLRKTGIIADSEMTNAQKQAAKSKTARISLSDAMGVAPVKNEALPMKTIRIKRPVDIPGTTTNPTVNTEPVGAATTAAKPSDAQADTKPATASNPAASFTQRKTIKITRPGGSTVHPTGKFGVKKPTAAPAASAEGAVADIADIPEMPSAPVAPVPLAAKDLVPDVPKGVAISGLIVQIAACVTIAFLGWLLFQDTQLPLYCGGCL